MKISLVTRSIVGLLLIAALAAFPARVSSAPGRWALVIGNDRYAKVEPLRNAVADARLIEAELTRAGFEVKAVFNADRRTMLREVIELARRAEGGGEAVLYYAGHGVQVDNTNFLLPVDFDGEEDALLRYETVGLNDISNYLLDAKTRFSLIIVDACRDNPIAARRGRSVSATTGLAPTTPATGQMIVFSAGNGQLALDSLGDKDTVRNGLFAREFAKEIRQPGRDVRDVMMSVRESVERLASTVNHAQRPAIYDESRGRFVFHAAPAASDSPAARTAAGHAGISWKTPEMIEDEVWRAVSGTNSPAGLAAYLREYPSGRYASAARIQLEMLKVPTPESTISSEGAPTPPSQARSPVGAPVAVPAVSALARSKEAEAVSPRSPDRMLTELTDKRLTIGGRTIDLRGGRWFLLNKRGASVSGSAQAWNSAGAANPIYLREIRSTESVLVELVGQSLKRVIVAVAEDDAGGVETWHVDPCKAEGSRLRNVFSGDFFQPECLFVREFSSRSESQATSLTEAVQWASKSGIDFPAEYYETVYAKYGIARFLHLTVFVPKDSTEDGTAIDRWARSLADTMRPLANGTQASAELPE